MMKFCFKACVHDTGLRQVSNFSSIFFWVESLQAKECTMMPAQILSWYSLKYFAVMILMLMLMLMLGQKTQLAKSYIFNETNSIKKKLLVKVLYDFFEVT